MSFITRMFSRKKPSYEELLDSIDRQIVRSEARQRLFQSRRQRLTRLVFLLSLLLYVVFSAWIYISVTMSDRVHITALRGVSMLAGTTLLAFLSYKAVTLYYNARLKRELATAESLRRMQKTKLEQIKQETGFYKMQKIIEKYDEGFRTPDVKGQQAGMVTPGRGAPGSVRRGVASPGADSFVTPVKGAPQTPMGPPGTGGRGPLVPGTPAGVAVPPTPSVPRERGAVDKLVDFITGDGPNNRFALICPHCGTHNGLVLPQDLDRIRYVCPRCNQWNRPPTAPTTAATAAAGAAPSKSDTSGGASNASATTSDATQATTATTIATTATTAATTTSSVASPAKQRSSRRIASS